MSIKDVFGVFLLCLFMWMIILVPFIINNFGVDMRDIKVKRVWLIWNRVFSVATIVSGLIFIFLQVEL